MSPKTEKKSFKLSSKCFRVSYKGLRTWNIFTVCDGFISSRAIVVRSRDQMLLALWAQSLQIHTRHIVQIRLYDRDKVVTRSSRLKQICRIHLLCVHACMSYPSCVSADVYTRTAVSRRPGQGRRKCISNKKKNNVLKKIKVSGGAFLKHLVFCTFSSLGLWVWLQLCGPSATITQCSPHRLNSLAVWSD